MDITEIDGVGSKTAEKLKEYGYGDVDQLAKTSPGVLSDRTGIGHGKAENIIHNARDLADAAGDFETGTEVEKSQNERGIITTGSDKLDDVFMGGIRTQTITEAYGEFGSGKTQLGLQLAVNTMLPEEEGGLDRDVLFIDTEDTFETDRLRQMAEHTSIDPDEAMNRVYVGEAVDSEHQMELAREKANKLCSSTDIGLVVVDSIIAKFRSEYSGRGELADRQQRLGAHLRDLKSLAKQHDVAVYITNQVHSDPGQQFGNPMKPVGGHVLGHASTYRMWLRTKKDSVIGRLVDSPSLPETEAEFKITEAGIEDA